MPFLTIEGTEVPVAAQGAAEREPTRLGEAVRAFDGSLRSTVRGVKRTWAFATPPLPPATVAALRALFETGAFVVCAGEFAGGASVLCEVRVTEAPYVEDIVGGVPSFKRSLALTLTEV